MFIVQTTAEPLATFGEYVDGAEAGRAAAEMNARYRAEGAATRVRVVRGAGTAEPEPEATARLWGRMCPLMEERAGHPAPVPAEGYYRVITVPASGVAWRRRESGRMMHDAVPWMDEAFWRESEHFGMHYPRPSSADPRKLAYTPDEASGMADRQLRIRPGRYLQKYFGDVLSPDEIQRWALEYDNRHAPRDLNIATTADDIERVFTRGPSSCMSHGVSDYDSGIHPTRAYAAGDLGVTYIVDEDGTITGRAVVWPDRMIHSRIYGDIERMKGALTRAGYTLGSLAGARLLKMEGPRGGWILPYLDRNSGVTDAGKYFEIASSVPDFYAESTTGVVEAEPEYTCTHCACAVDEDEAYSDPDGSGETYCEDCYSEIFTSCEDCGETVARDSVYSGPDGTTRCESCHVEAVSMCEDCGADIMADDAHISDTDSETRCESCHADHMEAEAEAEAAVLAGRIGTEWIGGASPAGEMYYTQSLAPGEICHAHETGGYCIICGPVPVRTVAPASDMEAEAAGQLVLVAAEAAG
jgi:hypothetical protein